MDLTENLNIEHNNFFETTFGKIINDSIESGIKALLPDNIENDIIDIKDTLINQGIPEAVNQLIHHRSVCEVLSMDFRPQPYMAQHRSRPHS